jgi:hypothetical protein
LVYAASETWVEALLEKAFTRTAQVFRKVKLHLRKKHLTSRSSISRCAPWTVFKSQVCDFAAQKRPILNDKELSALNILKERILTPQQGFVWHIFLSLLRAC